MMKILKIVFGAIMTAAIIGAAGTIIQNAQKKQDEENTQNKSDNEISPDEQCEEIRLKSITKTFVRNIEDLEAPAAGENHGKQKKESASGRWDVN